MLKQAGGLGPGCPKTGCPLFSALLSIQELHGWNQLEKLVKMVYSMTFSHKNWLHWRSSWGCKISRCEMECPLFSKANAATKSMSHHFRGNNDDRNNQTVTAIHVSHHLKTWFKHLGKHKFPLFYMWYIWKGGNSSCLKIAYFKSNRFFKRNGDNQIINQGRRCIWRHVLTKFWKMRNFF